MTPNPTWIPPAADLDAAVELTRPQIGTIAWHTPVLDPVARILRQQWPAWPRMTVPQRAALTVHTAYKLREPDMDPPQLYGPLPQPWTGEPSPLLPGRAQAALMDYWDLVKEWT